MRVKKSLYIIIITLLMTLSGPVQAVTASQLSEKANNQQTATMRLPNEGRSDLQELVQRVATEEKTSSNKVDNSESNEPTIKKEATNGETNTAEKDNQKSTVQASPRPAPRAVVATGTNGGCDWSYDDVTKTLTFTKSSSGDGKLVAGKIGMMSGFSGYRTDVTKIVFDGPVIAPDNCTELFYAQYLPNVTNIEGLSSFDTSNVTNMTNMFNGSKVTHLDLSSWNVDKVTTFTSIFYGTKLQSLNLSNWGENRIATNVNMQDLFGSSTDLTDLNLTNFSTVNVVNTRYMFHTLSSLKTLDLSSFDMRSVTNNSTMFTDTVNLWKLTLGPNATLPSDPDLPQAPAAGTTITDDGKNYITTAAQWQAVGSGTIHNPTGVHLTSSAEMWLAGAPRPETYVWTHTNLLTGIHGTSPWTLNPDTGELIYGSGTFQDAQTVVTNLESYDVDPDIVTSISFTGTVNLPANATSMFSGLDNLTAFDATNSYTDNVTNMSYMFNGSGVTTLNLSGWDVDKVTTFQYMFNGNDKLTTLNLANWGVDRTATNVNMRSMFENTVSLTSLNLTNFKTTNVTEMPRLFWQTGLTDLDLSDWDVTKVTTLGSMFYNTQLATINLSNWDVGRTATTVTMGYMFSQSAKLTNLNLTNFKTTNVIIMNQMFSGTALTNLDLSDWDVTKVTNFYAMFASTPLTTINVSNWGVGRTATDISMRWMFYNCQTLTNLNLANFKTTNVTNMESMFFGTALTNLDLSGWDVTQVTTFERMFYDLAKLTTLNLSGWNTSGATVTNMFAGTSRLWKITLGENIKFSTDPSFRSAPAAGTTIPGTSYKTTAASWQVVGTGTEFNPKGAMVTTTQMYADRTEPVTYVWANEAVVPIPAINTISSLNFGTLGASDFFNGNSPLATNMSTGSVALKDLDNSTTYNVTVAQTSDWTTDGESATIARSNLKIKYGTNDLSTGASSFWSGTSATATKNIAFNHDTTKNFSIWLNPNAVLSTNLLGKQLESELTWTLSETP
ncbi:BspA family leucine-rich repeat surface protein [Leuconostoc falkenbergense]|uniref:BspA family leucine-rich repeat surface protein n=1 Tax=Leuconostoc falkenbergense TaxID=2766470 RepID=UPI001666F103|nr:BspA family leucine-rich repeat surface protein [Leuconostoc falkenbergense]MCT4403920.1 BspA family leucine-rich repeat surface protein [Leuconostoc falkenbergense]